MYVMIYSEDKPDSLSVRQKNRDDHLKWLRSDPRVILHIAGPWLDEKGDMRGSLLIVESDALEHIHDWLARDPYALAGLTDRVTVRPYNWVVGAPST